MKPRWWTLAASIGFVLLMAGCAKKPVQVAPAQPPPPKQNIFALLPEPDGKVGRIAVTNAGGTQELDQPNQAVRVERADVAPSAPYILDQATVRRLFGDALDVLPTPEVEYTLHFDLGKEEPNAESLALLPEIFRTIQDRHSTAITVIGHTDITGDSKSNYKLGMDRARQVKRYLLDRGLDESYVFVDSHGDADPAVQTPRGQAEPRNRRVVVVVR